jgi:Fe-S-cluster containining protein
MDLQQHVAEVGRKRVGEILSKGQSPETVYEVVDESIALGDAVQERNPTSASALACKRGCNHCCHVPVGTSAPMVLRIAAAMRRDLDETELEAALARVVSLDEKTHGLPWSPSQRPPLPCALLVDGACSIYSVRPFVCRAWNSVDVEACRRFVHEEAVQLRYDSFQRAAFAGVEKGMTAALREHGLDTADLELTAAIRVALENTDACERWLAGDPVFAGCEAKRVPEPRHRLPLAP